GRRGRIPEFEERSQTPARRGAIRQVTVRRGCRNSKNEAKSSGVRRRVDPQLDCGCPISKNEAPGWQRELESRPRPARPAGEGVLRLSECASSSSGFFSTPAGSSG